MASKDLGRRWPGLRLGIAFSGLLIGMAGVAGAHDLQVCAPELLLPEMIRCYAETADQRDNPSVCLEAEAPVNFQCLSLYAEWRMDESACGLIPGSDPEAQILRDTCIVGVALVSENPALCAHSSSSRLADACFTQMVLERGADPALCDMVEDPFLKQACGD